MDEKTHQPLLSNLSLIVETAHKLREDGHRVVIVSSGAIGVGMRRMERDKRPKHVAQLQALAAIGQCRLMNIWDSLFSHLKQPVAQILLTRNDIADVSPFLPTPVLPGCRRASWPTDSPADSCLAIKVSERAKHLQRAAGPGRHPHRE